jgi:hypothetical protein
MSVETGVARPGPGFTRGSGPRGPSPENLAALDYRSEASAFLPPPPGGIIDAHAHLMGVQAPSLYAQVARLFGVTLTYSMTQLHMVEPVREALGDSVRFIAFPTWSDPDPGTAHREGYLRVIEAFRARHGSRILKIWAAPRMRELIPDGADCWEVDSPWRVRACELGRQLGMMYMVHVADPDTWFATRYADRARFGTKPERYLGLERMLDRFDAPWIAAHMGGWPEDLEMLDGLLSRHRNLYLDLSAARWMVRELSKHPLTPGKPDLRSFCIRWKDRLIFGTDVVVMDDHLSPNKANPRSTKADQASDPDSAFDLYASRFWLLRTLLESDYDAPSPVADPDLAMVDPSRFDSRSSPVLRGASLPRDVLRAIYRDNAERVLIGWERAHP